MSTSRTPPRCLRSSTSLSTVSFEKMGGWLSGWKDGLFKSVRKEKKIKNDWKVDGIGRQSEELVAW